MNLWESFSNWTSSISASIFDDRSVINNSDLLSDVFNLDNLTFSVDGVLNFFNRLNTGVWDSFDSANELFLALCQFANVVTSELFSGNLGHAISICIAEGDRALAWFNLSEFQLKLIKEFSLILAGNTLLVLLAWKVYGPRISEKFASSANRGSRQVIEDLRSSMSELQLPNEHDYKLK